jgi:4-hydroxy-tetrahydrodipicolinate reductase
MVVLGAAGRMGRAVVAAAVGTPGLEVKARVDCAENPGDGTGVWSTTLAACLGAGDVVVEFSSPDGAVEAARLCAERGAGLVSGATGLDAGAEAEVAAAAARVAVLRAPNFSLGVAALRRALAAALDAVPRGWDVEIVERHHRRKADSPSGTALALARDVTGRRGLTERALRFGRAGRLGARPADEVGVHAVRGGSWVGDHEVLLAGEGEWIELRHVAMDRAAFAHGAIAAVRFVATAAPGLYTLEHVLADPGRA